MVYEAVHVIAAKGARPEEVSGHVTVALSSTTEIP